MEEHELILSEVHMENCPPGQRCWITQFSLTEYSGSQHAQGISGSPALHQARPSIFDSLCFLSSPHELELSFNSVKRKDVRLQGPQVLQAVQHFPYCMSNQSACPCLAPCCMSDLLLCAGYLSGR